MKKQRVYSDRVREPADKMWSNCLRVGDLILISGLTARGADGESVIGDTAYEQAQVVFGKIKHLIEAAGAAMDDIVKMTIFVTNMKDNSEVWKARQEYFTGNFPACSLVEVSALAKPEILLEIEAIAVAGCSADLAPRKDSNTHVCDHHEYRRDTRVGRILLPRRRGGGPRPDQRADGGPQKRLPPGHHPD